MAITKMEAAVQAGIAQRAAELKEKQQNTLTEEDFRQIAVMETHIDSELASGRRSIYVLGIKHEGTPYIERGVALSELKTRYIKAGWTVESESDNGAGDQFYFS